MIPIAPLETWSAARWFRAWRTALAAYLCFYVVADLPFLDEMYTAHAGALPSEGRWISLGMPLASPSTIVHAVWLVAVIAVCSLAFGVARQPAALVTWVCLSAFDDANVAMRTPEQSLIKLALLLMVVIPSGEGNFWRAERPGWTVPWASQAIMWFGLVVLSVSAGVWKLTGGDDAWFDGSAVHQMLITQSGWKRQIVGDLFDRLPAWTLAPLTVLSMLVEIGGVVLVWNTRARLWWWCASFAMHCAVLALMDIAQVSLGMLMAHLFVIDRRWVPFALIDRALATLQRLSPMRLAVGALVLVDLGARLPRLEALYTDSGVLTRAALHELVGLVPTVLLASGSAWWAFTIWSVGAAAAVVLMISAGERSPRESAARAFIVVVLMSFALRNPYAVIEGDAVLLAAVLLVRDIHPRIAARAVAFLCATATALRLVALARGRDGICSTLLLEERRTFVSAPLAALACASPVIIAAGACAVLVGCVALWRDASRRRAAMVLGAGGFVMALSLDAWLLGAAWLLLLAPAWSEREPAFAASSQARAGAALCAAFAVIALVRFSGAGPAQVVLAGLDAASPSFAGERHASGWIVMPALSSQAAAGDQVVDAARDGLLLTWEQPANVGATYEDARTRALMVPIIEAAAPSQALAHGIAAAICIRAARRSQPIVAVRVVSLRRRVDRNALAPDVEARVMGAATCGPAKRPWPASATPPPQLTLDGKADDARQPSPRR